MYFYILYCTLVLTNQRVLQFWQWLLNIHTHTHTHTHVYVYVYLMDGEKKCKLNFSQNDVDHYFHKKKIICILKYSETRHVLSTFANQVFGTNAWVRVATLI